MHSLDTEHIMIRQISRPILATIFLFYLPFSAQAISQSIITANTIQGSAPYLTFDGGVTKVNDTVALQSITLSNGQTFNQATNPSSSTQPIELPVEGQTLANVTMFVPTTRDSIDLNDLISSPNNFWGDDEGDGQGTNGITATGTLSLQITDANGNTVRRNDQLTSCLPYYKITLSSTAGTLKTLYGNPNTTQFAPATTVYYIKPKPPTRPYVCYAQPSLAFNGANYAGPASQWDNARGFIPQNINNPATNFPTVGAYALFFNLTVANGNWQDISYDKTPSSSGISITISDGGATNIAKLFLTGPRYNTNNAATAVPTTFIIYSDRAKTNKIYSFTISKWFITTPGNNTAGIYRSTYCRDTYGNNYRIPSVAEYTNANSPERGWTGGLAGQGNNYQRRIGGGLLSEWGLVNTQNGSIYTSSHFDSYDLWAIETNSRGSQFLSIRTMAVLLID
ncbi:hypothetical protein PT273_05440 [Orbaceae bacterium ESL0727]|nr:hypothetical protein [Orbaceae bacterium ESL0727]